MSDLRKQVRDHYDAQPLSKEKVEALLAAGRISVPADDGAVVRGSRWTGWIGAVAAVLVLAVTGTWWMQRDSGVVAFAEVAPRVVEFFGAKPELVKAPQDKSDLKEWLVSKGAPQEFVIPSALIALESAACQVVDVGGKQTYLSCYWRVNKEGRDESDLIHLLIARADDFRGEPTSGKTMTTEVDGWSFASWTKGDVIYTLAAAAPLDKVSPFISVNEAPVGMSFISSITR